MNSLRRSMLQTNASMISIAQRISDTLIMFASMIFAGLMMKEGITEAHSIMALTALVVFQMIGGITDFYRSWRGMSIYLEIQILIRNWTLSIIFSTGILSVLTSISTGVYFYFLWYAVSTILFIFSRVLIRSIIRHLRKLGYNTRNIVIVGGCQSGGHLAESINKAPWLGFNILGYYLSKDENPPGYYSNMLYRGDIDNLISDAKKGLFDRVYIALKMQESNCIEYILSELSDATCTVMLVPDVFTYNLLQSHSEIVNGIPVISLFDSPMSGINMLMKRAEDIIVSLAILAFISPVLFLIAILVKLTSPGPVIFKQTRYGIDGKAIKVWKFRSMTVMENGDEVKQARKGDARLTPIGGLLRRTSLDELPQFINVILGDMSIVGPRPHAVAHNEQYRKIIKGYMLRHKMKPGITGWAQISGWRGETDTLEKMEKRVEYDLFYIRNWSIWLDFKIIILTVFKGFVNKSAY
ncbi:undecaprenyl-phosphate glucose phosphotransferase [Serratia sp. PL7]|uniref:undecaprenyl-phosphate glucose phosphotransferase n=1 Tax=Serratia sp. PL7 TaxID=2952201 RepID=UPI0019EFD316|nr:undecaprenyl-phosphate glucose phosphotransferase [Serratia sp. PL7]MBE0153533.1 undecaprenyl-phosphate glucose phosphotransferase [Serratia fonticola]